MPLEQAMGHIALDILWNIISPQLPGLVGFVGFLMGIAFSLSIVMKWLAQFGFNAAATGDPNKKPLSRR